MRSVNSPSSRPMSVRYKGSYRICRQQAHAGHQAFGHRRLTYSTCQWTVPMLLMSIHITNVTVREKGSPGTTTRVFWSAWPALLG